MTGVQTCALPIFELFLLKKNDYQHEIIIIIIVGSSARDEWVLGLPVGSTPRPRVDMAEGVNEVAT